MPTICFRVNNLELERLTKLTASERRCVENRDELLRLLIHREYNRAKGLPKPEPKDYQTAFRIGRPKEAK
jgi:hypothetical protein